MSTAVHHNVIILIKKTSQSCSLAADHGSCPQHYTQALLHRCALCRMFCIVSLCCAFAYVVGPSSSTAQVQSSGCRVLFLFDLLLHVLLAMARALGLNTTPKLYCTGAQFAVYTSFCCVFCRHCSVGLGSCTVHVLLAIARALGINTTLKLCCTGLHCVLCSTLVPVMPIYCRSGLHGVVGLLPLSKELQPHNPTQHRSAVHFFR
jgi:hypothetical protein